MSLFGKDDTFYVLLEGQAEAAHRAATVFHTLTQEMERAGEHAAHVAKIELEADDLTHAFFNRVDSTFVTPLDKEDLQALSHGLDDITDAIEAAVARLVIYRLQTPRPDLQPLVSLLVKITQAVQEAVAGLRDLKKREAWHTALTHIHDLESEGDRLYRQALDDLFNGPNPDTLLVLKWKEVYERIETSLDECEQLANVLEGVGMKYA